MHEQEKQTAYNHRDIQHDLGADIPLGTFHHAAPAFWTPVTQRGSDGSMEKGVTRGRSDEDQAKKPTTFTLEIGNKLSGVGYGECQAHEQNRTGMH